VEGGHRSHPAATPRRYLSPIISERPPLSSPWSIPITQHSDTTRHTEDEECEAARKYWAETGDIGGTLRRLPRQLHIERLLLQGYQKMGKTQHLTAFQTVSPLRSATKAMLCG
jgi:hypothetical protein